MDEQVLQHQILEMKEALAIANRQINALTRQQPRGLLSYNELCELVEQGVIVGVDPKDINAASIDVHLGSKLIVENYTDNRLNVVDIAKRQLFSHTQHDITNHPYELRPDEFVLAQTMEKFYLPDNIVAEFKLKSSGARTGLENALATWCDCGWNDSVLTLELKNFLRYHALRLTNGMPIGQMIFYRVTEVPKERSYATIGRYNGDSTVQVVKR